MSKLAPKTHNVASLIFSMRGERVLLSEQLAELYGVTVSALNQAVKRIRLESLRQDIRQGLDGGSGAPWDPAAAKRPAQARRSAKAKSAKA
jgi:ORF6N domain